MPHKWSALMMVCVAACGLHRYRVDRARRRKRYHRPGGTTRRGGPSRRMGHRFRHAPACAHEGTPAPGSFAHPHFRSRSAGAQDRDSHRGPERVVRRADHRRRRRHGERLEAPAQPEFEGHQNHRFHAGVSFRRVHARSPGYRLGADYRHRPGPPGFAHQPAPPRHGRQQTHRHRTAVFAPDAAD